MSNICKFKKKLIVSDQTDGGAASLTVTLLYSDGLKAPFCVFKCEVDGGLCVQQLFHYSDSIETAITVTITITTIIFNNVNNMHHHYPLYHHRE